MARIVVEIRWNASTKPCVCPVSGRTYSPRVGMVAFLPGGKAPISTDFIAEVDQHAAGKIARYARETREVMDQMKRAGRPYPTPQFDEYFDTPD